MPQLWDSLYALHFSIGHGRKQVQEPQHQEGGQDVQSKVKVIFKITF
jgi:hypothetical protein